VHWKPSVADHFCDFVAPFFVMTCRRVTSRKRLVFRRAADILRSMSGISFLVDEHGKKTAAVVDLRRHGQLWEDIYDSLVVAARPRAAGKPCRSKTTAESAVEGQ